MEKPEEWDAYIDRLIPPKDLDIWYNWMVNNEEFAEKEYSEMMELVREIIRKMPSYIIAESFERIPEHFVKWKNDIENSLPLTRERKIKECIKLIKILLYQEFDDVIENTLKKIKPELIEMKQYFENLQHPSLKKKGFQSSLTDSQIKSLYTQLQGNYIDTTPENFEAIFSHELPSFTPIKRKGKFTNSLLIYFASELFQKENPLDYVSITEYCFNGKNLSQSQNNYIKFNNNQKPKGYQQIDKIIQTIYPPLQ